MGGKATPFAAGKGKAMAHGKHGGKAKMSLAHKLAGKKPMAPDESGEDPAEEAGESKAKEAAEEAVEQASDDYTNGASHAEMFQKRMASKRKK